MEAVRITRYTKSGELVSKRFRAFFIPALLSAMATQMGVWVDTILMAQLIDGVAMTSATACQPLSQLAGALTVLISTGAVGQIAVAAGNGRRDEANRIFSVVFDTAILFGLLLTAVLLPTSAGVSRLLTPVPDLWDGVHQYLRVLLWRFPFCALLMLLADLVCADGMEKLATVAILIQQVTNVILDFVFIRLFHLGIGGAALATVISDVAGLAFMLLRYFRSPHRTFRLLHVLPSGFRKLLSDMWKIARAGVGTASGYALVAGKMWFLIWITGNVGGADGAQILAACLQYLTLLSMFSGGINMAVLPLVGVLYGEKDYAAIRMLMRRVICLLLAIIGFAVLFAMIFPQAIFAVAGVPQELGLRALNDVRLYSVSLIGTGLTFLMIYYYTTVARTTAASVLSFTEGLLAVVPAVWLLSLLFGLTGIWLGLSAAEIIALFTVWIYTRHVCRKSGRTLTDFFLIEKSGSELLYDASLRATREDAAGISAEVVSILREKGIDELPATKTGIVLEETAVHLAEVNPKKVNMDVRVLEGGDELLLVLRDNGMPFNPMEYTPEETEDPRGDGIMVIRRLAGRIEYSLVLALNQTTIAFPLPKGDRV